MTYISEINNHVQQRYQKTCTLDIHDYRLFLRCIRTIVLVNLRIAFNFIGYFGN